VRAFPENSAERARCGLASQALVKQGYLTMSEESDLAAEEFSAPEGNDI